MSNIKRGLSERGIDYLLHEYDILKDLYIDAGNSAQNIFNFYLSLISATIAGAVLIIQFSTENGSPDHPINDTAIIAGMMVFVAVIGLIYIAALSHQYGNLARYGLLIDEIRKHLLQNMDFVPPIIFHKLINKNSAEPTLTDKLFPRWFGWIKWFWPTGAYQLFISVTSSLALSIAIWILFEQVETTLSISLGSFLFYNFFSRRVKNLRLNHSAISIDIHR